MTTDANRISVWVEGETLMLSLPAYLSARAKAIVAPKHWDAERRLWVLAATPENAQALRQSLTGLTARTDRGFRELLGIVPPAPIVQDHGPIPIAKTIPWQHQEDAFWFVTKLWGGLPKNGGDALPRPVSTKGAALYMEMGVG